MTKLYGIIQVKQLISHWHNHFNICSGAGGGWTRSNVTYTESTGFALLQGGNGGTACYESYDNTDMGAGGFGGGGGGCTAGGGGGGYTGKIVRYKVKSLTLMVFCYQ